MGGGVGSRNSTPQKNEVATSLPATDVSDELPTLSPAELSQRWGEVEFLLKSPLTSEDDVANAEQAAAQGLRFIDDLTRFSQQMGENRGLLLRWVLPFDATTSIADQSNVQGAGSYEGAGTGSAITPQQDQTFSAVIDKTTKAELLAGALALRQLVRVKLSDEADLQQGLRAGTDTHTFLKELRLAATKEGTTTYAFLQKL